MGRGSHSWAAGLRRTMRLLYIVPEKCWAKAGLYPGSPWLTVDCLAPESKKPCTCLQINPRGECIIQLHFVLLFFFSVCLVLVRLFGYKHHFCISPYQSSILNAVAAISRHMHSLTEILAAARTSDLNRARLPLDDLAGLYV